MAAASIPTKTRLRNAALDLVACDGMESLSVRSLCRQVGIRESSFYAHFPSKRALVDDLLRTAGAHGPLQMTERLEQQCSSLPDFARRLIDGLVVAWTDPTAQKLRALLEAEISKSSELRSRFNDQILAMIDRVGAALKNYQTGVPQLAQLTPRVLGWSLVAPVATMRANLFAHGAQPSHLAEGRAIASAHVEAWIAVYCRLEPEQRA